MCISHLCSEGDYFRFKCVSKVILFYGITLDKFKKNIFFHHDESILPKGRSFTANSETKTAVLLKGRSSTANLGTQAAVSQGMDRCGSPVLSAPVLSLASEQILKVPRKTSVKLRRLDLANWALRTSPKFTTGQGLNISSFRVFDQIRDAEISITLHLPGRYNWCNTSKVKPRYNIPTGRGGTRYIQYLESSVETSKLLFIVTAFVLHGVNIQ